MALITAIALAPACITEGGVVGLIRDGGLFGVIPWLMAVVVDKKTCWPYCFSVELFLLTLRSL